MEQHEAGEREQKIPEISLDDWTTYCGSDANLDTKNHSDWRLKYNIELDGLPVRILFNGKPQWMDVSREDFGTLFD